MGGYTLPHELMGEGQRLALRSALLDPVERTRITWLGARPGWRCLELGCGDGSITRALAERVARSRLNSGYVNEGMLEEFHVRYQDSHYWTSVITFIANWGRKPV